jgi:DNA modification methylase
MNIQEPLFSLKKTDANFHVENGDCLNALRNIEDSKFDLILTSPPYNIGKSYETKTSIEKYLEAQETIIIELVGSTLIGAIKNNRNAIGIEKEVEYCNITRKRIDDFEKGKLKFRPINKPIHKPNGNDKISKIPQEWLQLDLNYKIETN